MPIDYSKIGKISPGSRNIQKSSSSRRSSKKDESSFLDKVYGFAKERIGSEVEAAGKVISTGLDIIDFPASIARGTVRKITGQDFDRRTFSETVEEDFKPLVEGGGFGEFAVRGTALAADIAVDPLMVIGALGKVKPVARALQSAGVNVNPKVVVNLATDISNRLMSKGGIGRFDPKQILEVVALSKSKNYKAASSPEVAAVAKQFVKERGSVTDAVEKGLITSVNKFGKNITPVATPSELAKAGMGGVGIDVPFTNITARIPGLTGSLAPILAKGRVTSELTSTKDVINQGSKLEREAATQLEAQATREISEAINDLSMELRKRGINKVEDAAELGTDPEVSQILRRISDAQEKYFAKSGADVPKFTRDTGDLFDMSEAGVIKSEIMSTAVTSNADDLTQTSQALLDVSKRLKERSASAVGEAATGSRKAFSRISSSAANAASKIKGLAKKADGLRKKISDETSKLMDLEGKISSRAINNQLKIKKALDEGTETVGTAIGKVRQAEDLKKAKSLDELAEASAKMESEAEAVKYAAIEKMDDKITAARNSINDSVNDLVIKTADPKGLAKKPLDKAGKKVQSSLRGLSKKADDITSQVTKRPKSISNAIRDALKLSDDFNKIALEAQSSIGSSANKEIAKLASKIDRQLQQILALSEKQIIGATNKIKRQNEALFNKQLSALSRETTGVRTGKFAKAKDVRQIFNKAKDEGKLLEQAASKRRQIKKLKKDLDNVGASADKTRSRVMSVVEDNKELIGGVELSEKGIASALLRGGAFGTITKADIKKGGASVEGAIKGALSLAKETMRQAEAANIGRGFIKGQKGKAVFRATGKARIQERAPRFITEEAAESGALSPRTQRADTIQVSKRLFDIPETAARNIRTFTSGELNQLWNGTLNFGDFINRVAKTSPEQVQRAVIEYSTLKAKAAAQKGETIYRATDGAITPESLSKVGVDQTLIEEDPFTIMSKDLWRSQKIVFNANIAKNMINRFTLKTFGKEKYTPAELQAEIVNAMKKNGGNEEVSLFLTPSKIDDDALVATPMENLFKQVSPENIEEILEGTARGNKLVMMPQRAIDFLKQTVPKTSNSRASRFDSVGKKFIANAGKVAQKVNNMLRQGLTVGFGVPDVAFNMRNILSDQWLGWLGGITPFGKEYFEGLQSMIYVREFARKGKITNPKLKKWGNETLFIDGATGRPVTKAEFAAIMSDFNLFAGVGVREDLGKNFDQLIGVSKPDRAIKALREMRDRLPREAADLSNSISRAQGMIYFMKRGLSAPEAAMQTKAMYYDYSNLTEFERTRVRQVIPFWSWVRFNTPNMLRDLMEKPARTASLVRATSSYSDSEFEELGIPAENTPEWMAMTFPILFHLDDDEIAQLGTKNLLPATDLLTMAEAVKDPGGAGVRFFANDLFGGLGKMAIEQSTNTSFWESNFSDFNKDIAPLEEYEGQAEKIQIGTGGMRFGEIDVPRRMTLKDPTGSSLRAATDLGFVPRVFVKKDSPFSEKIMKTLGIPLSIRSGEKVRRSAEFQAQKRQRIESRQQSIQKRELEEELDIAIEERDREKAKEIRERIRDLGR